MRRTLWTIGTFGAAAIAAALLFGLGAGAQDRDRKVRSDRETVVAEGGWIYDDLPRGVAEAKTTGKPLLVIFRCIPCEACAQLDEDVVGRDPKVRALLDRFVCVRIPKANGLDLSIFQYDYDQSWAAFMLHADMTIYGRYGTRSHRTRSEDDVTLEGFAKSLEAALALHARHPEVKASLAAKRGAPLEVAVPEEYPSFGGKFGATLDYEGKVAKSCIHCHQVAEAQRNFYRDAGRPVPERLVHPYPHPSVLGLRMDPKERARVAAVVPDSPAAKDGFRAGDAFTTLSGQPIVSVADVQWVLHHAPETGSLAAEVEREGKPVPLTLTLPEGWRRNGDLSWRATSWDLRRATAGGMQLVEVDDAERKALGLDARSIGLRATHVGEYGAHAAAKNAGFRKGDVIVAADGLDGRLTESQWMATVLRTRKPGSKIRVTVLRDGKRMELVLPVQ